MATTRMDLLLPAGELANLLDGVHDAHLTSPTPCDGWCVRDLLEHLLGLTVAFTAAAERTTASAASPPPSDVVDEEGVWRCRLRERLDDLVAAWRDPAAWTGDTEVGGVRLTGEQAGVAAIDELVLHGWDLARATGQPYRCDPASTEAVLAFTSSMASPEGQPGLFGPAVEVPATADPFTRALALSGRDPAWTRWGALSDGVRRRTPADA